LLFDIQAVEQHLKSAVNNVSPNLNKPKQGRHEHTTVTAGGHISTSEAGTAANDRSERMVLRFSVD